MTNFILFKKTLKKNLKNRPTQKTFYCFIKKINKKTNEYKEMYL